MRGLRARTTHDRGCGPPAQAQVSPGGVNDRAAGMAAEIGQRPALQPELARAQADAVLTREWPRGAARTTRATPDAGRDQPT